jgi:ribosome recycling factor
MDIDTVLLEAEDRMNTGVEYFQRELRGVRTGRATPALVEYVKVDYYGSSTDLRELVKPFDPSSKAEIIKAIESAGIGVRAQAEGSAIRVLVPAPSADRRKQLGVQVKKMSEESKVVVRNERRDANKAIDALLADKKAGVTEDQAESAKESIDELTKKFTAKIEELAEKKIAEIEEI